MGRRGRGNRDETEESVKLLPEKDPAFISQKRRLCIHVYASSFVGISLWIVLLAGKFVFVCDGGYSLTSDVVDVMAVDVFRSLVLCAMLQLTTETKNPKLGDILNNFFDFTTLMLIVVLTKFWVFRDWHDVAGTVSLSFSLANGLLQSMCINKMSSMEAPRDWKLNNKSVRLILRPYFVPTGWVNKVYVVLTWLMVAASKIGDVVTPLVFGNIVSRLSSAPPQDASLQIGFYCLLLFSPKILTAGQGILYTRVWQTAYGEVADVTFRHVHSLSLEWHLKKKIGSVQRAMDRGMEAADNLISYVALYILPTIASSIATFIVFVLHFNQPLIAGAAFLSLFTYCWVTYVVTMWRRKYGEKMNAQDNDMHEKAADALINFETVKYFTNEDYEARRYLESVKDFQTFTYKAEVSVQVLNLSQSAVQQLCMFACLYVGCLAILNKDGNFAVSDFVSVQMYIMGIFAPLSYLGSIYSMVITSLINMQNLSDLLAEEPDIVDVKNATLLEAKTSTTIEFKNVIFRYPTQIEGQGIRGVSFTIPSGTTTAIVGQTGCGKTTIARLFFRFYNITSGEILINGQNIAHVTQKSLRGLIGIVPQDTVMFNDTIRYNIAYGKSGATQTEIEDAARQAQLLPFIESLDKKWDTQVGERGLKLSGGEKQRVAIARCLLKNVPIVVLDEATSALDNKTEREVQQALETFTGRTMLVIAHRLSTVRHVHQILVMFAGQVVERGTHDELIQKGPGGHYFDMWNAQLRTAEGTEEGTPSLTSGEGAVN